MKQEGFNFAQDVDMSFAEVSALGQLCSLVYRLSYISKPRNNKYKAKFLLSALTQFLPATRLAYSGVIPVYAFACLADRVLVITLLGN